MTKYFYYNYDKKLSEVIDNSIEGFQLIGFDWRYLYVNSAVVKQSKYPSKEDLLGFTMMEKYPGIDKTELFKVLSKCMKERISCTMENEFVYNDGTKGWYELRIQPAPEGIFILSIDITHQKNFIMKLEEKVAERTEEVLRQKSEIEKRNDELKFLNYEKDRFLSIISHDILNFISTTSANIKQVKSSITNSDNAESTDNRNPEEIKNLDKDSFTKAQGLINLSNIERNLGSVHALLADFLTISRIQNGIISPQFNLVDLNNLIKEVISRYEDLAANKHIAIKFNRDAAERYYKTDISYFSIIADNLISNAIKFSQPGKNIWVELEKRNKNLVFQVKDEGPGMTREDMTKLYKRFQKLSARPTQNEPSTGLGLSIVKDLVGAINADIKCDSQPGKGTTFSVICQ